MTADLIVLQESNQRDVPGTLRIWADEIEEGKHGKVRRLALVIDANELRAVYMGEGEVGVNLLALLKMGAAQVLRRMMGEQK